MTYKGKEIKEVTLDMVKEYIAKKNYNLSAEEIFELYELKGWKTSKGKPAKSLEALINARNGVLNPNSSKKKRRRQKSYNSEEYKELLKTEEWISFREKVLELHNHQCDVCQKTESLHVHHKAYRKQGKKYILPWGYYFSEMAVLCEQHHREAHGVTYQNKV